MPGSDVDVLFNRVLPILPVGTLIHIHDIFLPSPYPSHWDWRGYNEQNALATMLAGGNYQIVAANQFARMHMKKTIEDLFLIFRLPLMARWKLHFGSKNLGRIKLILRNL